MSDEQQEDISDPKLTELRRKIDSLCREADVGYHMIIHNGRDKIEFFHWYSPSYSILIEEGPDEIRIRTKPGDDPTRERQHERIAATANMISQFGLTLGQSAMSLIALAEVIDKTFNVEHSNLKYQPEKD